jgi:4-hydroxythreonine-4-phosphate dehydrogenase
MSDSPRSLPRVAVTMGDPAGIGPEIALKAVARDDVRAVCAPVIIGDPAVLKRVADRLNLHIPEVRELTRLGDDAVRPGTVSAETGRASYRYVEAAIDAALAGEVAAIVTGPIHKEAWHAAGVPYPGHTEILAARTRTDRYCMMLTSEEITCSLVTVHVGYAEVPELLSVERIGEVIELTAAAMRRLRGREPRLVVCGLNPHAGEHGLFGRREEEILIAPAVEAARRAGLTIDGPLPPDTAFLPARRRQTDAYVCMYHDQGLIPLKTLAFDRGVNVTLGLPIVRTSVDHGTALDIAWQGKADESSLVEAIRLAARLASGC